MAEQFSNKISTTLAAPYVAASGTAVVTSDAGMPATGTFRLRLGNLAGTILIVQSRVGTTLTVTVEEDDGNADAGATVTLINTAGAMLQLKADAIAGSGAGGSPRIFANAVDAPTTGTVAETLYTFTVPADTLANDGESLHVMAHFLLAANGNNKSATIEFGGTVVWGTGQAGFNNFIGIVSVHIFRLSATTQKAVALLIVEAPVTPSALGGANVISALDGGNASHSSPAETLSGAITLAFRALTPAAAGDVTGLSMTVDKYPAP